MAENRRIDQAVLEQRNQSNLIASGKAYNFFIRNEHVKAYDLFRKINSDLTTFEKRLADYLEKSIIDGTQNNLETAPAGIDGSRQIIKQNRWDRIDLLSVLLSLPFSLVLGTLPFFGIYYLYYSLQKSLFVVKPGSDLSIIFGLFLGILLIIPIKKIFLQIFLKNSYADFKIYKTAHDDVLGKRIIYVLATIILALTLIFFPLGLRQNLLFYQDYMIDNTKFFSWRSENIPYSDIDVIYRVDAFKNDNGEIYSKPSIAIQINSGKIIDLRPIGMPDDDVLSFLLEKGIVFRTVKYIEEIR